MSDIGRRIKAMLRKESDGRSVKSSRSATLESVGRELKDNPPRILAKTRAKKGKKAADKQRVAILLSKARRGARV